MPIEYLSKERHDSIVAELEHLINVEFPRIKDELSEARAQGDLSENFEYHAACHSDVFGVTELGL